MDRCFVDTLLIGARHKNDSSLRYTVFFPRKLSRPMIVSNSRRFEFFFFFFSFSFTFRDNSSIEHSRARFVEKSFHTVVAERSVEEAIISGGSFKSWARNRVPSSDD